MATKPNWIEGEYQRRVRGDVETLDESARERHFQKAEQATWERLASDIRSAVQEFWQLAGPAEFSQISDFELCVRQPPLVLVLTLDLDAHTILYDYQSEEQRAAAPEGGIFTLRLSRYGRADICSSDERLSDEEARRMLLEPVLFPEA